MRLKHIYSTFSEDGIASVQEAAKRKLQSKSLVGRYSALKEIEEGDSCISIAKKYGVTKGTISHWLKKKQEADSPKISANIPYICSKQFETS